MATSPQTASRANLKAPPVTALGMVSIGLVAGGVIWLASYLPRRAPLGPAIGCLAAAVCVLVASVVLLLLQKDFAWRRFRQVAWWALLAYVVIAGMIEYAFVYDKTRGPVLVIMTLLLATFTATVPLLLAFTVARFQDPADPY
jgi:hypothetical protein